MDEQEDQDRDCDGRQSEEDGRTPPPDSGDERRPDDRDDDRADVAAGDVGADGEAASLRRELLGQQAVADRVLGEPPIRDVIFGIANVAKLVANAWSAKPPPNSSPPTPSKWRRATIRVSPA